MSFETRTGAEAAGNGGKPPKKVSKWVEEHMKYAERQGKPWPLPRPDCLAKNEWYGTLTNREQDWVGEKRCKLAS